MTDQTTKGPSMRRRGLIFGVVALAAGGGIFASRWYNIGADISAGALSVQDAHAQAVSGDIFLIDIRRPDEWARTGVGEGGHCAGYAARGFHGRIAQDHGR